MASGLLESLCVCRIAATGQWSIGAAVPAELAALDPPAGMVLRTARRPADRTGGRLHLVFCPTSGIGRCRGDGGRRVWILLNVCLCRRLPDWRRHGLVSCFFLGRATGGAVPAS